MSSVTLEWQQSGVYDSFNIFRALSPMDINSMPEPIASTTAKNYTDLAIEEDKTYYYRVASVRNESTMMSAEVSVSTSSDPNAAFLTNHLNFETSSLFDKKTGSNWSATGSISYVPVADKIALSIAKPSFISAPGVLSASSSFTAVLDITFLNEPTYPHQAIFGLSAVGDQNLSINVFRLNGSGIAVYAGSAGVVGSGVNLPNNTRLLLKIVKKSNGTIKFFINDALINTQNFTYNVASSSRIQVGYNDADPSRGLNAVIHEFRYYHGKEID
jgi:hypothetical protein